MWKVIIVWVEVLIHDELHQGRALAEVVILFGVVLPFFKFVLEIVKVYYFVGVTTFMFFVYVSLCMFHESLNKFRTSNEAKR